MLTEAMIDARVDDAVKQHRQKMDWLHAEEEAQSKSLTPKQAGTTGSVGKMGFNLPLNETPQAQEVIAPLLEIDTKESIPPPVDSDQPTEGKSSVSAEQDCEDASKAEVKTTEKPSQPDASTDSEKPGSSPPKDGTPV